MGARCDVFQGYMYVRVCVRILMNFKQLCFVAVGVCVCATCCYHRNHAAGLTAAHLLRIEYRQPPVIPSTGEWYKV